MELKPAPFPSLWHLVPSPPAQAGLHQHCSMGLQSMMDGITVAMCSIHGLLEQAFYASKEPVSLGNIYILVIITLVYASGC